MLWKENKRKKKMKKNKRRCTRFKDCNGRLIYEWDVLSVEEYPDKFVGGSYDFIGVVEREIGWNNKEYWAVVYYDIGEREPVALSRFPIKGREIIKDKQEIKDQNRLFKSHRLIYGYQYGDYWHEDK